MNMNMNYNYDINMNMKYKYELIIMILYIYRKSVISQVGKLISVNDCTYYFVTLWIYQNDILFNNYNIKKLKNQFVSNHYPVKLPSDTTQ